jgi:hypothetical protein
MDLIIARCWKFSVLSAFTRFFSCARTLFFSSRVALIKISQLKSMRQLLNWKLLQLLYVRERGLTLDSNASLATDKIPSLLTERENLLDSLKHFEESGRTVYRVN